MLEVTLGGKRGRLGKGYTMLPIPPEPGAVELLELDGDLCTSNSST